MVVKARFRCNVILEPNWSKDSKQVFLTAVYSTDPDDPNYQWSTATPAGTLQMVINNPDAAAVFKAGQIYELSIEVVK